jgi:hypothetical protein
LVLSPYKIPSPNNQKVEATADPAGIMGFKRCREAESTTDTVIVILIRPALKKTLKISEWTFAQKLHNLLKNGGYRERYGFLFFFDIIDLPPL